MSVTHRAHSRRLFLQFLATSPLMAAGVQQAMAEEALKSLAPWADPIAWDPPGVDGLISSPAEALNVFDFEAVAHRNVPPAHFGFMASGVDSDSTLRANRSDFGKFALRPRRLRDVSRINSRLTLFGATWDSPVFICPAGGNKAYHPDGEIAVAKAAEAGRHLQMLSTTSSTPIEDVISARGGTPVWFQLYPTPDFSITKEVVARA